MSETTNKDVVGVMPGAYSASNSTPNYGFPIFLYNDKPAWLSDWNQAMTDIDSTIKTVSVNGSANTSEIETLKTALATANTAIESLNNSMTNANETLSNHETRIGANETSIDTIQNDLIAQNTLVKQLSTTVEALNTKFEDLSELLNDTVLDVSALKTSVNELESNLTILSSNFGELSTQVTEIDKRSQVATVTPGVTTVIASFPFSLIGKKYNVTVELFAIDTAPKTLYPLINHVMFPSSAGDKTYNIKNLITNQEDNVTFIVDYSTSRTNISLVGPDNWDLIATKTSICKNV